MHGVRFFFNDTATTEIYTLSLHDALPIFRDDPRAFEADGQALAITRDLLASGKLGELSLLERSVALMPLMHSEDREDRKSTRLNSSHANISYAVFCLKKKNSSRSYLYDLR